MQLVQHGATLDTRVEERFEAKDIGAPFKVILKDAVRVTFDKASGVIVDYSIPDLDGLLANVVLSRILHPRKLAGSHVKFVRKALGIKQKQLAAMVELSPEHLSRCEAGSEVLSPGSEKLLRIYALKMAIKIDRFKACEEKTRFEDAIDKLFDVLKPKAAFDASDELVFEFCRHTVQSATQGTKPSDDGRWIDREKAAA